MSALEATFIEARALDLPEQRDLLERLRPQFDIDVTDSTPWDADSAPAGRLIPDGPELITDCVGGWYCPLLLEGAQTV